VGGVEGYHFGKRRGDIILLRGKYRPLEKYFEIILGVKMARIGVNRSNKK